MKKYLSAALALAGFALVVALVLVKRADNAQLESDAGTITNYSNWLDSAQMQINCGMAAILTLSNNLGEASSAALTFSNQLMEAQSTVAHDTDQITSLNRQVVKMESENQALTQRVTDLTGQMTSQVGSLTQQLASTKASLDQANQDYALLENRFRIDVAERLVIQRKFYNLAELQAQMQKLQEDPFIQQVSAGSIYAGLDVEVKSNSFHVISPN